MRYGMLPEDLGLIDINPTEMLFHMYMPVSLPGSSKIHLPDHLKVFADLIILAKTRDPQRFHDEHVYLTAKTLWVSGEFIGNRPGWHSDGFGTDDLNYIWADRAPTVFLHDEVFNEGIVFNGYDCNSFYSMCNELGEEADMWDTAWKTKTFNDKHLLRLDPSVIHRSPINFEEGMRSFAKVSISKDIYNLKGNATNHLLNTGWVMQERNKERNHPHKG